MRRRTGIDTPRHDAAALQPSTQVMGSLHLAGVGPQLGEGEVLGAGAAPLTPGGRRVDADVVTPASTADWLTGRCAGPTDGLRGARRPAAATARPSRGDGQNEHTGGREQRRTKPRRESRVAPVIAGTGADSVASGVRSTSSELRAIAGTGAGSVASGVRSTASSDLGRSPGWRRRLGRDVDDEGPDHHPRRPEVRCREEERHRLYQ